jgi:hypothetical protein
MAKKDGDDEKGKKKKQQRKHLKPYWKTNSDGTRVLVTPLPKHPLSRLRETPYYPPC